MAEIVCRWAGCGKVCASLQGWKRHMSAAHGGYDDSDLADVAGSQPVDNVKDRMLNFSATIPVMDGTEKTEQTESAPPVEPPVEPAGKRIKATPKKLKKVLGDIPTSILIRTGIEMDEDDKDAMDEAADCLASIFGFEFVVPESKYVVESRFAAILWVIGVMGIVWIKHRMPDFWKLLSEKEKPKSQHVEQNNRDSRAVGQR